MVVGALTYITPRHQLGSLIYENFRLDHPWIAMMKLSVLKELTVTHLCDAYCEIDRLRDVHDVRREYVMGDETLVVPIR
jgi:hypothetical protein